ncbi:hypothetical protein E4L53_07050 [Salmonella enterica subsp. enterica serovar Infantis]|nr:hypothetical protein E4L53_07050 [Salmonella enterica subsp. enterica serovar Infantis]
MLHPAIDDIAQNTTRHSIHLERLFNQNVRCKQLRTEKIVKFMPQVSITWMTQVSLHNIGYQKPSKRKILWHK